MPRHNNVIPNVHCHKDWQSRVKTWFNQPARKKRRRDARAAKAKAISPRPVKGMLRPIVHGSTIRYNMKTKLGRGFTLDELKAAGISAKLAPTIGIAVDHRRTNKSEESLKLNVDRLVEYKSKLVIFPRRSSKPKKGDSPAEELKNVVQMSGEVMPIKSSKQGVEYVTLGDEAKSVKAYAKLRLERMNARMTGIRKKRAEEEEKEANEKAKLG